MPTSKDTNGNLKGIDKRLTGLEGGVARLDKKTDNIALEVVSLKQGLRAVQENMATKEDVNKITNLIDQVMGEFKSFEDSLVIRGHWIQENSTKLEDHEHRIKKLETSVA